MIIFDTRHDPLHLQAFPPVFTQDEVDAHFDEVEAYFVRRNPNLPTALLADARGILSTNARQRQRVALAFERLSPVLGQRAVAHAIVMDSAVVRGALTAVFWIKRPPWPIQLFGTMEEADLWIRQRFAEEGLRAPEAAPGWWSAGVAAKTG